MCGINAIIDFKQKVSGKTSLINIMNGQMVYRGPDDEGIYGDSLVALGMRRLSIIDLKGGHQPIFNEDGSLVIVCNGEIYNYKELQEELAARGHLFRTKGDTEIILHLYEELGESCLNKLRGMFAFIIWDRSKRRVFVARDRVGIKPLYFCERDGILWFSSELKAILAASKISPTLNTTAIWQFLHYGYPIDQRNTVVNEIKRILPGEYISAEKDVLKKRRYWHPRFGKCEQSATDDEIFDTLKEAIRMHLRSDVPVGILLSGGIDSSTIAGFASNEEGQYTALCAGYRDFLKRDERQMAHDTANYLGLHVRDVVLDAKDFALKFSAAMKCIDEPVADPSLASQWALYEAAQNKGYKVVLSGIGGDELFFGYDHPWNTVGSNWMKNVKNLTIQEKRSFLDQHPPFSLAEWLLKRIASNDFLAFAKGSDNVLNDFLTIPLPGPDSLYLVLFSTYLVQNGLFLADKLGMGCSLEVRVPLIDNVLVDVVLSLPISRRFSSTEPKILLKRLMSKMLPSFVLKRRKYSFAAPTEYLKALIIENKEQICEGILSSKWLRRDLLSKLTPATGISVNRFSSAFVKRSFMLSRKMGLDLVAFELAKYASVEFMYRILVFERWWDEAMTALLKPSGLIPGLRSN